jgi:hypothetical protein
MISGQAGGPITKRTSIIRRYVAYMSAGDEHDVPGGGDNENDHNNESDEETNARLL